MTSTYSTNLRLELIGTGDQSSTWGSTTNTNLGTLLEQAVSGVANVVFTTDADKTLSTVNGGTDEARQMIINLTSTVIGGLTATRNVIVPSVNKMYIVKNGTAGGQSIIIKTSAGTGVTITNGETTMVWCNATNVYSALDYVPGLTIGTDGLNLAGNFAVGPTAPTDNVAIRIQPTLVSAVTSQYGVYNDVTLSSSATSTIYGYQAVLSGGASGSAYTTSNIRNFSSGTFTKGTNQTVTNLYGYYGVALTAATNNYGLFLNNDAATASTISSIVGSAGTVTVTTSAVHGLATGDKVLIANVSNATMTSGSYNGGPYTVNVTNTTVFTYSSSAASPSVAGGNVVKANNWNVYTNGTENNLFSGPVITTVSSTLPAMRITQTGTGDAFVVEDSANPDVTPFVIDTTGRTLVGFTSARTNVDSTVSPQFQIEGTTTATSNASIARNTADNSGSSLALLKSRGTSAGANTVVTSGDGLGNVTFYGADGTNMIPAAQITASVDNTPGANDMPGRLVFSTTADGAATVTERLRINAFGNLGLGSAAATAAVNLTIAKDITGAATSSGVHISSVIQSDVTANAYGYISSMGIATASNAIIVQHFRANQGTFTGTAATQIGFNSTASGISATSNIAFNAANTAAVTAGKTAYGFNSDIDIATGGGTTWAFYGAGTAPSYFAGGIQKGYDTLVATKNYANTALTPTFQNHGTTAATGNIGLFNWASAGANPAGLVMSRSKGTTAGTRGVLVSGDDIGQIVFNGDDGTNFIPAAAILAEVDGTPGTNDMPGRLTFWTTADNAATPTEQMRISNDGVITATAGNVLLVQGTSQTVSATGTAISFTGIPSWAKRITFLFADLAVSGTSPIIVQLGSTTYSTSGYLGGGAEIRATPDVATSGLGLMVSPSPVATDVHNGIMILSKLTTANIWVSAMSAGQGSANQYAYASGGKSPTLSGVLDRVQITTVAGTGTFTGTFNIYYE